MARRFAFEPLPELTDPQFESRFCVRLADTDMNRHVNHVHYVQWTLESAARHTPEESVPLEMEADYKAAARMGDEIIVRGQDLGNGIFHHQLILETTGRELTRLRTTWG